MAFACCMLAGYLCCLIAAGVLLVLVLCCLGGFSGWVSCFVFPGLFRFNCIGCWVLLFWLNLFGLIVLC